MAVATAATANATADSASNVTTMAGSPASGDSSVSVASEATQVTTARAQAEEALQNLVNDNPATEEPETSEEQQQSEPEPETTEPEDTGEEVEGEAELGDKGKKALNRMKAAVKASKHEVETLKARIPELETQIFNANVEKAATGKLQHPELAMRLVEGVDVNSDSKAIDKAIDAILRKYPDMGVPAHDSTTDSLQELFGAKPTIPEGESRTRANAAVFGSQLAALGL
ncbi:hypothetical protein E4U07_04950 [Bifidobacterium dentium]|uniref:hypothetical protein n=1 Tax=Bifidobacterium dentium TaxID=1689 RepID=UPI00107613F6|nr:hypothetical protein [Bifidobacterium dentium]TFZ22282.1 hypothetical protein E4U07_04950 [Bifidobacterium dentium]